MTGCWRLVGIPDITHFRVLSGWAVLEVNHWYASPANKIRLASLLMSAGDHRSVLIKQSFLHDDVQVFLMHNQVKILEWITIDQKQIGDVAFFDLTEFVAHSHYLPPDAGAALQRLAG